MSLSSTSGKYLTTLLKYICQTEVEVNILKFLESCVVYEGEDVHFQCLVSHEEAPLAQWKLQDVPLQNNEMNLIKTEGQVHSLTLRGVTKADSGTVTFTVGNHTSTASLTVRGKTNVMALILGDEKEHLPFSFHSNIWTSYTISLYQLSCGTPSLCPFKKKFFNTKQNMDACDFLRLFIFTFLPRYTDLLLNLNFTAIIFLVFACSRFLVFNLIS